MCLENDRTCTIDDPCGEWEGVCNDLENHFDCQIGLRCGKNNCQTKQYSGKWTSSNCCFKSQGIVLTFTLLKQG